MTISFLRPAFGQFPAPAIGPEEYVIPLLQPDKWLEEAAEGELAVDVFETPDCFVVQSTVAGVQPGDLTLSLHNDLLTIRGRRTACTPGAPKEQPDYLIQECYWGNFSRSILLPEPIDASKATAALKQGILTIFLPKRVEQTEIEVEELNEE